MINNYVEPKVTPVGVICSNTATLKADGVSGKGVSGYWEIADNGYPATFIDKSAIIFNSNDAETTVSGLDAKGTYIFNWVVKKVNDQNVLLCTDKAQVIIENKDFTLDADEKNAINEVTICKDSYTLAAQSIAGAKGEWQLKAGTGFMELSDSSNPTATVTNIDGSVTYTWTVKVPGGCEKTSDVTIYNSYIKPVANLVDDKVCSSTFTVSGNTFQDNINFSGYWEKIRDTDPGNFNIAPNVPATTQAVYVNLPKGQTVGLRWHFSHRYKDLEKTALTGSTVYGYCTDYADIYVTNNDFTVSAGQNSTTKCDEDFILLDAEALTADQKGFWQCPNNSNVTYQNNKSDSPTVMVYNLSRTVVNTFEWHVSNTKTGCETVSYVDIENNSVDDAIIKTVNGEPYVANKTYAICNNEFIIEAKQVQIGTPQWTSTSLVSFDGKKTSSNYLTKVSGLSNNSVADLVWSVTKPNGALPACSKGVTISVANKYAEAKIYTKSQNICDDNIILEAEDVAKFGAKGWWTYPTSYTTIKFVNDISESSIVSVTGLPVGTAVPFTWHVKNGNCEEKTATVDITNATIVATASVASNLICEPSTTLIGSVYDDKTHTGLWSLVSGDYPENISIAEASTNNRADVSGLSNGTYKFRWTVTPKDPAAMKCARSADVEVTNYSVTAKILNVDANNFIYTKCDDHVTLRADLPSGCTGTWSTRSSGTGTAIIDATCSIHASTIHISNIANDASSDFIWTVESKKNPACHNSTYVSVKSNKVVAEVDETNPVLCWDQNDTYTLTAHNVNQGTGFWTPKTGNTGKLSNTNDNNAVVTGIKPRHTDVYTWHVTLGSGAGMCEDQVDVVIANHNYTLSAGDYSQLNNCDTKVHLSADNPGAQGSGAGYWIVGNSNNNNSNGCYVVDRTLHNTDLYIPAGETVLLTWVYNMNEGDKCPDRPVQTQVESHRIEPQATSKEICYNDPNATLEAHPADPNKGEIGWWTAGDNISYVNNESTNAKAQVRGLVDGPNTFVWHVKNAYCEGSVEVIYTNIHPDARFTPYDPAGFTQCEDKISLSATFDPSTNSDYVGKWIPSNNLIKISDPTNYSVQITDLQPGNNRITWEVTYTQSSCKASQTLEINNNGVVINDIPSIQGCGDKGKLTGNGPDAQNGWKGEWSIHDGWLSAAQKSGFYIECTSCVSTVYHNLPTGSINLKWTVTDPVTGCYNYKDVVVYNNSFQPRINTDALDKCSETVEIQGPLVDRNKDKGWWSADKATPVVIHSPSNTKTLLSNLAYGSNSLTWHVIHNGCEESTTVNVEHYRFQNFTAGADVVTCDDGIKLDAFDPYLVAPASEWPDITCLWEVGAGNASFVNKTLYNTDVTNLNTGKNKLKWIVSNSHCPKLEAVVVIINNGVKAQSGWGDDFLPWCSDVSDSYGLSATMPTPEYDSVAWAFESGGGSFSIAKTINQSLKYESSNTQFASEQEFNKYIKNFSDNCHTAIVSNLNQGKNEISWNVWNKGCHTSDTVRINNISPDKPKTQRLEICKDEWNISANQPAVGNAVWVKKNPKNQAVIASPYSINTKVTKIPYGETELIWRITNIEDGLTCTLDGITTISNKEIEANAGEDDAICQPETDLDAQDPAPYTGYWIAKNPEGITIQNSNDPKTHISGLRSGDNTFIWVRIDPTSKCEGRDEVIITNNKPTTPKLTPTEFTSCTSTADLKGNSYGKDEIGWWFPEGGNGTIENSNAVHTKVTGLGDGKNEFTWHIKRGDCEEKASVTIYSSQIEVYANAQNYVGLYNGAAEYCDDVATVKGSTNATNYTSKWTTANGGASWDANSTNAEATASNLSIGRNVLRWEVEAVAANGQKCTTFADVVVYNNKAPIADIDEERTTCGTTADLLGNMPVDATVRGEWNIVQGTGYFDDSNNAITTVRDLSLDRNYITWTLRRGNNCFSTDKMVLSADVVQTSVQGDNGTNVRSICGETTDISGAPVPNDAIGWWTTTSSSAKFVSNESSATVTVEGLSTGSHTFVWHVLKNNGCRDEKQLVVVNEQYEATANMSGPNPVCNGEVILIGNPPTGGATGYWTGPPSVVFKASSDQPIVVMEMTTQGTNIAYWHIDKGNCKSFAAVEVQNYTVSARGGNSVVACSSTERKQLNAEAAPEGGKGWWSYVNGSFEVENTASNRTKVYNIGHGVNTVQWNVESKPYTIPGSTISRTCTASEQILVYNNQFTADAGQDFEVCGPSAKLHAVLPPNAEGHWSGGKFNHDDDPNTVVSNLRNATTTELKWTVKKDGCEAEAIVNVTNTKVDVQITSGSKIVCSETTDLQATMSAGTGTWSVPSGRGSIEDSTNPVTTISGLMPGKNTIRWDVKYGENNCHSIAEVVVDNRALKVSAGSTQYICDTFWTLAGQPLEENQVGKWSWGVGSNDDLYQGYGPTFEDPTKYNTRVFGLYFNDDGNGYSNAFTWHIKDTETGCEGEATVQIISYHFIVDADKNNNPNKRKQTVDDGNTAELAAAPSTRYSCYWKTALGSGKITNPNQFSTSVSPLSPGLNKFRFEATLKPMDIEENGKPTGRKTPQCTASDIVEIAYEAFSVNAGTPISICEDSVQLNAEQPEGAVAHWTSQERGCEFDNPTNPKTWVRHLKPGKNVLFWNVSRNGYTAIDTLYIYNYGFYVDAGPEQHLCEDSTELHASAPLGNPLITDNWSGYWDHRNNSSATYEHGNSKDTKVTDLAATTNELVWHVKAWNPTVTADRPSITCEADTVVKVAYYLAPDAEFVTNPKVPADCSPLPLKFTNITKETDTLPVTYLWNFENRDPRESHSVDEEQEYTFFNNSDHDSTAYAWLTSSIKIPGGKICTNKDSIEITIFSRPVAKFTATPERQKQPNTTFNFTAVQVPGDEMQYAWSFGDNDGVVWKDNSTFQTTLPHTYQKIDNYQVVLTVTNKWHCSSSDTKMVYIDYSRPVKNQRELEYNPCLDDADIELITGVQYCDSVRWYIKLAGEDKYEGFVTGTQEQNAHYPFHKPGKYILEEYAFSPALKEDSLLMRTDIANVWPSPTIDFTAYPDTVRLPNQALYTINNSQDAVTYEWDFGDDSPKDGDREPTHYYQKAGDYYVNLTIRSDHNCAATTDPVHIRVEPEGMLRFPNAFRPNPNQASGGIPTPKHNYVFIPTPRSGIKADTYKLQIFNRYGEKIFESNDPEIGWDGYYRGKLCNQDVYVWKCNCIFENGKIYKKIGNVTLLR